MICKKIKKNNLLVSMCNNKIKYMNKGNQFKIKSITISKCNFLKINRKKHFIKEKIFYKIKKHMMNKRMFLNKNKIKVINIKRK